MTLRLTSPQAASVSSSAALIACIVRFMFDFDHAMELERLARRQPQRVVRVVAGDVVELQPLLGRGDIVRPAGAAGS